MGKNGRQGTGSDCLGYSTDALLRCRLEYPKNPSHCPSLLGAVGLNDDTLLLSG